MTSQQIDAEALYQSLVAQLRTRLADGHTWSVAGIVSGGAWIAPYDPTANRERTSLPSLARKGAPFSYPPNLTDGKVYQDEWVAYLRRVRPAGSAPPI